jgi:hypothetical protein
MAELNADSKYADEADGETQARPVAPGPFAFAHSLLFSGHMIDEPDRNHPRFPASAEGRVRDALRGAVAYLAVERAGSTIGLAGAANGGDILFHEVCAELRIPTRILLALPIENSIAESVAPAGQGWVDRFHALLAARGPENVCFLHENIGQFHGESGNVWQRTNLWIIEEGLALAPEQTLLALWDGKTGDGPGGTEHFVETARRFGVHVAPFIEMRRLWEDASS